MRPDSHKKKKNAQYKKKHGISEKEGKPGYQTQSPSSEKKEKSSNVRKEPQNVQPLTRKECQLEEEVVTESKHYERCKIGSNWSRYEDSSESETDADIPRQRGEDFNKLLAEAGGSASQFRFKDEMEWTDGQGSTTATLAIDFEELSETLSCIPLDEKLGICESVFSEQQKNEMTAFSKAQQRKQPFEDIKAGFIESENVKHYLGTKTTYISEHPGITNSSSPPSQKDSESSGKQGSKVDAISNDRVDLHKYQFDKKRNEDRESLEDDLDKILSLDECLGDAVTSVCQASSNSKLREKNTELIDKKDERRGKNTVKNTGEESLEDFLSSVLDD